MGEPYTPRVGEVIVYTDPYGKEHDALVIHYFGGEQPDSALNLVYVTDDESKSDSYGRQIERKTSISRQHEQYTAHGNFWNPKV